MIHGTTRVSRGFRVVVPVSLRKKHRIEPGDELIWREEDDGIRIVPRKRLALRDIAGIAAFPGDAVREKRRVQRSGK